MGYYSDVVIAVDKSVLAEDLINPIIPHSLKDPSLFFFERTFDTETARYWIIIQRKWYEGYERIDNIEAFFNALETRELHMIDPLYGAIRIGEDHNDTQTWGDPYHFDIGVERKVYYPEP